MATSELARLEIPPGTLDLLILRCLADGPKHGYAITRRLRERSGERFLVDRCQVGRVVVHFERGVVWTGEPEG